MAPLDPPAPTETPAQLPPPRCTGKASPFVANAGPDYWVIAHDGGNAGRNVCPVHGRDARRDR